MKRPAVLSDVVTRPALAAFVASGLVAACSAAPEGALAPEEVSFPAADGVVVHADRHRAEGGDDRPLVILFHQAGSNARAEYATITPRLVAAGYDVLAVDQRQGGERFGGSNRTAAGSGRDDWTYCEAYPDLEAALAWAVEREISERIAVWGSSYSAALVIRLAVEHPDDVDAVLAFSPASGPPMGDCDPGPFAERLSAPALMLRPVGEVKNPSVAEQLAGFEKRGHRTWIADPGVHGSSMLVPDRAGGDVERTWKVVLDFLGEIPGA